MEFDLTPTFSRSHIFLDSRDCGVRFNKVAVQAYFGFVGFAQPLYFWGYGNARDTVDALAWGILHGLRLGDEENPSSDLQDEIFHRNSALDTYLNKYVPYWEKNGWLTSRNERQEAAEFWQEISLRKQRSHLYIHLAGNRSWAGFFKTIDRYLFKMAKAAPAPTEEIGVIKGMSGHWRRVQPVERPSWAA